MALGQIDAFMDAISGTESGGDYDVVNDDTKAHGRFQILPSNWPSWSREAGLGYNAPRTPENQDKVARYKMSEYYRQYGSWAAVAVAWFAGPGRAASYVKGDKSVLGLSDGNMTVGEYIDAMQRAMGNRDARQRRQDDPGQQDAGRPEDIDGDEDDMALLDVFNAVGQQISAHGDPWGPGEEGLSGFFNDMGQRAEEFTADYEAGTADAPEASAAPPPPGTQKTSEGDIREVRYANDEDAWDAGEVLDWGQQVADAFDLTITSHTRSEEKNEAVGGAENSDHLWGGGIDFAAAGRAQELALYRWLKPFEGKGAIRLVLDEGDHIHVSFNRNSDGRAPIPGGGGGQRAL